MEAQGKISFWSAVLLSINIIIGAGIFFNPKAMTAIAGNYAFLGWIAVSILLFPIIWSLSKAAAIFPGEGGFYNYCSQGINPTTGFLAHWAYLIGYIGTASTYCTVIREMFASQVGIEFFQHHPHIVNILLIAFVSVLNLAQMSMLAKIQSGGALIKMIPLIAGIILGAFYFGSHGSLFSGGDITRVVSIVSIPMFSFLGFEVCCSIGHLIEGGSQKASQAILTAFFITAALYTLFHIGVMSIMGTENLANLGAVAFPSFLGLSPALTHVAQSAITFFILFSVWNGLYGVFSMNITNIHMLAKKNLIVCSSQLSATNKNDRPVLAILVHALVVLGIVTLIQNSDILMVLTCFGVCLAYILSVLALTLSFIKKGNYPSALFSTLGLGSCSMLMYFGWLQMSKNPVSQIVLVGALLSGLVLYGIQKKIVQA